MSEKQDSGKKKTGQSEKNRFTVTFDTGSDSTAIDEKQIKGLSFKTKNPIRQEMQTLRGRMEFVETLVPSFRVSEQEFGPISVSVVSGDFSVLGMDFLSQFNITISGPDNTVYLEPRAGEAGRYRMRGVCGIYLTKEKNGENASFRVAAIGYPATLLPRKDLPAIGDKVVVVDGVLLENLTYSNAEALLQGYADTTATITFRSFLPTLDSSISQVKIRRVSPFDPRLAEQIRTR
jgi:hypothetical protein